MQYGIITLMGLDIVELVMRTEGVFAIELPDNECEAIRTVGDLYSAVLEKLNLPYIPSFEIEANSSGKTRTLDEDTPAPWTTPDVWITLKSVIQEQLGVERKQIVETAAFVDDLGAD